MRAPCSRKSAGRCGVRESQHLQQGGSRGSNSRPTHLDDAGAVLEVGERPHDVLTHGLNRLLPAGGEASDQLGDPGCRQTGS